MLDKLFDASLNAVSPYLDSESAQRLKARMISDFAACNSYVISMYRNAQYNQAFTLADSFTAGYSNLGSLENRKDDLRSNDLRSGLSFALSTPRSSTNHFQCDFSTPASSASQVSHKNFPPTPQLELGTTISCYDLKHKTSHDSQVSWGDSAYGSLPRCGNTDPQHEGCLDCIEILDSGPFTNYGTAVSIHHLSSMSSEGSCVDPSLLTNKSSNLLPEPSTTEMDTFLNRQFQNNSGS
jgi:hypothetical protein